MTCMQLKGLRQGFSAQQLLMLTVVPMTSLFLSACGGTATVPPQVALPAPQAPQETPVRVHLPAIVPRATWHVSSVARISINSGDPEVDGRASSSEEHATTSALVSWALDRTSPGVLRGTGEIDSFTVHSTIDTIFNHVSKPTPALNQDDATASSGQPAAVSSFILLDAVLDSLTHRVVTRPARSSGCDLPEAAATELAGQLLMRIPDNLAADDHWRDSTVSVICRAGIPITVTTVVESSIESLEHGRLTVVRAIRSLIQGNGGSAFRAFELSGQSTGRQRVFLTISSGIVESLEGESTMTLTVSERIPTGVPRIQKVLQNVDLKAERVHRLEDPFSH